MKVCDQPECAGCPVRALWPEAEYAPPKLVPGDRLAIGMNPGRHEVAHQPPEPFVGPSGSLLWYGYSKIGLSRRNVSRANVHQCRLPLPFNLFLLEDKASRYVLPETAKAAVEHCWRVHVIPLLQSRQWARVDLLGAAPLEIATGKSGVDMWGGYQQELLDAPHLGAVAVGTYHPAYLLRDVSTLPLFYSDLRRSLTPAQEQHVLQADVADFPAVASLDLETDTAKALVANVRIRLLAVANRPYQGICFGWNDAVQERLQRALNNSQELYGHNLVAFDMPVLEANGITFPWNYENPDRVEMAVWDTMLMHHLLWPALTGLHDLGVLGRQYTTQRAWKQWRSTEEPEELYACRDAGNTLAIGMKLKEELCRDLQLYELYKYVQLPLARICRYMSANGLQRDPARLQVVRAQAQDKIAGLEAVLPEELRTRRVLANRRVPAPEGTVTKDGKPRKFVLEPVEERVSPWNSAKQLGVWLYETKGYPEQFGDSGSRTTNKIALEKLWHKYRDPALNAVRQLKALSNLLSNSCREFEEDESECLHPSFLPHGTSTGRLSSSGPNVQNIPEIARYMIVPSEPGWVMWAADFSQIEPRLTAWFSKDKERLHRFDIQGFNEHKYVTSVFFDIPYQFDTDSVLVDEIEKDNDQHAPYGIAKRINNGFNYCRGARDIALKNDWDLQETRKRFDQLRRLFPRCVAWQQATMEEAKQRHVLYTPFKRKGQFFASSSGPAAVAFRPQSSAADICFRAMIALLYTRIGWPRWKVEKIVRVVKPLPQPARVLAQIHDQLLGECPREALADTLGAVHEVMSQPWPELEGLAIPVVLEWGESWKELEKWKGASFGHL